MATKADEWIATFHDFDEGCVGRGCHLAAHVVSNLMSNSLASQLSPSLVPARLSTLPFLLPASNVNIHLASFQNS